jgi:protein ImuB
MKGEIGLFAVIHAPGIASSGIPPHFSPRYQTLDPHTVAIDIAGLRRLLGDPYQIAKAIAAQAGPNANIAIASNQNAAVCAARGYSGIVVIPLGEEAARLGGLPIDLLETSSEILSLLHRWGIHTFRELAALPEDGLVERLGQEGCRLRNLALGRPDALLEPDTTPKIYSASLDLEDHIHLLEPLCFVLSRLFNQICLDLQSNGLAALSISLLLQLENRQTHERTIRLPVPGRDPVHFLKLFHLDLEARPPAAPITAVTVTMEPTRPRTLQEGLFIPPSPDPEKLELTLQRLTALVGQGNVGSPQLIDTHRPGAFQVGPALQPAATLVELAPASLAFRAFRPPLSAQVHPRQGPPQQITAGPVRGRVLVYAGPWRTSGDWWTANPWARDDFDLALSDGALYRLYFEFFSKSWFLAGRYD